MNISSYEGCAKRLKCYSQDPFITRDRKGICLQDEKEYLSTRQIRYRLIKVVIKDTGPEVRVNGQGKGRLVNLYNTQYTQRLDFYLRPC